MLLADKVRIIRADRDALRPHPCGEGLDQAVIVNVAVIPEARGVALRIMRNLAADIFARPPGKGKAGKDSLQRAAAVTEQNTQRGKSLKHASADQRDGGKGDLRREERRSTEGTAAAHALTATRMKGMHKHREVERLSRFKDWEVV